MATLVNDELDDMLDQIKQFKIKMQDAFYEQYKGAYILSQSTNFRGDTADAYKNYITTVPINFINAFINISEEITTSLEEIKSDFLTYEGSEAGIVDEITLDDIASELQLKKNDYVTLLSEIATVTSRAGEYIATTALSGETIIDDYDVVMQNVRDTQENLLDTDDRALEKAEKLYDRIGELLNNIDRIKKDYYTGVKINYNKVGSITQQEWYQIESSENLDKLLESDPFSYIANTTAIWEDQIAAGYSSDIYGYLGGRLLGAEGSAGWNNGVGTVKGNFSAFSLNGYGQLTDWLRWSTNGYILGGSGEAKIGWSDEYKGFSLEGEAAVAKIKSSIVAGTEDFNGSIDFTAEAGSVGMYCVAEFEGENNFDIGLGANVALARLEISPNLSFLELEASKTNEDGTETKVSLFEFKPGVSIGGGAGAGARITNENVYDGESVNINVTSIKLDAELLLGVSLDLSIPTFTFD